MPYSTLSLRDRTDYQHTDLPCWMLIDESEPKAHQDAHK